MNKDDSQLHNSEYIGTDGFIYMECVGDQNYTTLILTIQKVDKLIEETRAQNKRALVICNISKVTKHDAGARKVGQDALKTLHYEKFAICGGDFFTRSIASILVKAIGRTDVVKFFKTREDAIDWLKS